MKKLFLSFAALFAGFVCFAQTQASLNTSVTTQAIKSPALDKSPLDIAYFPVDYPMLKTQSRTIQAPLARIIYSRPQRDNREIFGELIEYNKVWRLGANEATEVEFFKDALVGGKKVPKGRYTLYAIPTQSKWTLIINKDTDTWGAFIYDAKKDVTRIETSVESLSSPVDAFSIYFTKITDKSASLVIAWDKAGVTVPVIFQ